MMNPAVKMPSVAVQNHNAAPKLSVDILKLAATSHNHSAPLKLNAAILKLVVTNHNHSAAPRLSVETRSHVVRCLALRIVMVDHNMVTKGQAAVMSTKARHKCAAVHYKARSSTQAAAMARCSVANQIRAQAPTTKAHRRCTATRSKAHKTVDHSSVSRTTAHNCAAARNNTHSNT